MRDVGRALGLPYAEVDRIAKMVPDGLGMTLDRALETVAGAQGPAASATREFARLLARRPGARRHWRATPRPTRPAC